MARDFDLIVFGASGFTGKHVVEEIVKMEKASDGKSDFTWAVAGRSKKKLDETLAEVSKYTGSDLKSVTTIEADVKDESSLEAMAGRCNVLISCVGPYRFFGEPVVKACVAAGTNYVDVCGEPQFLEKTQVQYHQEAKKKNIYIIGACGFDSIPSDLGTVYLQQKFGGDLNSVEMFLEGDSHGKGSKIHYATYQSAIYGLAHSSELRELRDQLFLEPLPKPKYKMANKSVIHYSNTAKGWCLPFPGADRSVVKRSQYHFYKEERLRPTQMNAYFKMPGLFACVVTALVALVFGVMAQFKIGRSLLERFPRLFTLGMVTHDGPSREEMKALDFKITLFGEGWNEKLAEPSDQHSQPPNKKMKVVVSGNNPGYGATCIMVIQAALTVLKESNKMPSTGGVYPPGAAFAKTTLVHKLNASGVTFVVEAIDP